MKKNTNDMHIIHYHVTTHHDHHATDGCTNVCGHTGVVIMLTLVAQLVVA